MNGWLIIGLSVVALWVLFGMLNLIANLIDHYRQASAAASREDSTPDKERGSFSLWQQ